MMSSGPARIQEDSNSLSQGDFEFFRERIRERAGINLSPAKRDLVQTRLRHRMGTLKLSSFSEYRRLLEKKGADDPEWQLFINELTTNKTDFFREPEHFEFLSREFLPAWPVERKLKIWCAASSTGEEPYTTSMVVKPHSLEYEILATDIDTRVIATASNAVYHRQKLIGVPDAYRGYFNWGKKDLRDWARIDRSVKKAVKFREHNLLSPDIPSEGPFDLIFCRNVFIYFAPPTVERALASLYRAANPGAYLFIGHSESLQKTRNQWIYRKPSVYQKGSS
jgi:chemotaxis methyl-accepting protein methylase